MKTKLAILGMVVVLSGCATGAIQQQMVVQHAEVGTKINPRLLGSVTVRTVSGGQDTNPLWISQVGTNEFKGALVDSLRSLGLEAKSTSDTKVIVDANLQSLSQPFIGMTFNVTSVVNYVVERGSVRKNFPISAVGTATVSDAFLGTERMRLANERSIKENIKQFVAQLSSEITD